MAERHQRLWALASGQDSQFATRQALELGFTYDGVRALRDSGQTTSRRRGVWRFTAAAGAADDAVTAYLATWPHGVVSHASAAVHHGLRRVARPLLPHVVVPMGTTIRPSGIVVHHTRNLAKNDILRVGNVRYTSVARTVCDLADADDPWETLALLDDAIAGGARRRWLHHRATVLAGGRAGVALIAAATAPDAAAEFRSWLERAAAHVFRMSGLPDPMWNVPVRDAQGLVGVIDCVWPNLVVCELEGLRFHTAPSRRRADAKRFNRLADAGYSARRYTWEDIAKTPTDVGAGMARALRTAGVLVDPRDVPDEIRLPSRPFM